MRVSSIKLIIEAMQCTNREIHQRVYGQSRKESLKWSNMSVMTRSNLIIGLDHRSQSITRRERSDQLSLPGGCTLDFTNAWSIWNYTPPPLSVVQYWQRLCSYQRKALLPNQRTPLLHSMITTTLKHSSIKLIPLQRRILLFSSPNKRKRCPR